MDARRRLEGFEASASPAQQPNRGVDVADRLRDRLGIADSPFLTTKEAACFCRFDDCADPAEAFLKWARRFAVPGRRRGRELLWTRAALEAAIRVC